MHTIVGLFSYHTMSAVHRQINSALLYQGIPGLLDHPRNAMAAAPLTRGIAVFVLFGWILGGCSEPPAPSLEVVKRAGKLVVLTRNTPTTYYEGPDGPAGIEYDMAKGFADTLNVELEMVVPESFGEILPMLAKNEAHMAAAGLIVTDGRRKNVRFGPHYHQIRQQVVYRLGTQPPKQMEDLIGRQLEVARGTSYAERLRALKQQYPGLEWTEVDGRSTEDLLRMVWDGLLEFTIADSNIIAITRQYYPELRVAFAVDEPQPLAWAFPISSDNSIYNIAVAYFKRLKQSGELDRLIERDYGPSSRFNYINLTIYHQRIRNRLPRYETIFKDTGDKYRMDWRLLAAIGYQESFWDPLATSPTGVRGMMMLTQNTAADLGITDRVDPFQSIDGGTRYIRSLIDRIPKSIRSPDRTWMALAAYNVGLRHLEDARVITQQRDGNPDKWNDVKQSLPLLSKPAWHKKTKHGFARGVEPVRFVSRVRTYYDVLIKVDEERASAPNTAVLKLQAPAI